VRATAAADNTISEIATHRANDKGFVDGEFRFGVMVTSGSTERRTEGVPYTLWRDSDWKLEIGNW
jgi:hypothetical protein